MKTKLAKIKNPLSDLINDDVFELLYSQGIFLEKGLRDYQIRKKFKQLRLKKVGPDRAFNILKKKYKCLQKDTIRKIVYIELRTRKEELWKGAT